MYDYMIHPRLYKRHGGTLDIDQDIIDELERKSVLQHVLVKEKDGIEHHRIMVTPTQLLIGNFKNFCQENGIK